MSDNSNIQNSLFEAMQIFSKSAIDNSGATITIEGLITKVIDEGAGQYEVEYLGNTFTVHTNNNATYSVGDNVYILVPDGDFTKEKIILGTISASSSIHADLENAEKSYYDVSDNLIDTLSGTISMSSYGVTSVSKEITSNSVKTFGNLINGYLGSYRTFKLSFKAKTSLVLEQQAKGNYGVSLSIPIKVTPVEGGKESPDAKEKKVPDTKVVTLDVGNMFGTPYRFMDWSPQELYFTLDEQYEYDDSKKPILTYFCNNFSQDADKAKIIKDIQLKEISFQVVNEVPEEDTTGYTLTLKATQGEFFSTFYNVTKRITPTLKINGKKTMSKDANIYWFRENVGVRTDSAGYVSYGGNGWECINPKTNIGHNTDGSETFDYITTLEVIDVTTEKNSAVNGVYLMNGSAERYKCVIVYKGTITSAIIALKNLKVDTSVNLYTTNSLNTSNGVTTISGGNNIFIKDTGYVDLSVVVYYDGITNDTKNSSKVTYSWIRYDKDGHYVGDDDSFFRKVANNKQTVIDGKLCFVTQIKFPVNKLEEFNTVYCTASYIDVDASNVPYEKTIGTAHIGVGTSEEYDFNLTINGDEVIYKYDTDGDSPAGTAYDGPSTSKVSEIMPLTFTVRKMDGNELTEDEYNQLTYCWKMPKDSLFVLDSKCPASEDKDGYYWFTGKGNKFALRYKIANRFTLKKAKQVLNLEVDFNGTKIYRSASITFLKEGMSGTNGTAYSAYIASGGISESDTATVGYGTLNTRGVAQKLKFVYNSNVDGKGTGKLFRHDYNDNKLYEWDSSVKRLYAEVFRDSVKLQYGTHYNVEWTMFDPNTTNPCFMIEGQSIGQDGTFLNNAVKANDVKVKLLKTPTTSGEYCSIVQAKILVTDANSSSANASQIIYAYYPLEITITNFDTKIIPSMDGGFAEVMYASDGTNPMWDETSDFIINDDGVLISELSSVSEYFNINWSAKNHLGFYTISKNTEGEEIASTKKATTATGAKVKIKPDNKYDSGNSLNFIKATLTFNEGKRQALNTKKTNLNDANKLLIAERDEATKNIKYIRAAANYFKYQTWMSSLDKVKALLEQESEAAYHLENLLQQDIVAFDKYLDMQKKYNEKQEVITKNLHWLEDSVKRLQGSATEAIYRVRRMDNTYGHKQSDLISLANYVKDLQFDLDAYIVPLGREMAVSVKSLVDNMIIQINGYQKRYENLQNAAYTTQLDTCRGIKDGLHQMANQIGVDAYPKYLDLKQRILDFANHIDDVVTHYELSRIIEDCYRIVLSQIYLLDDNKLTVQQYIEDEYKDLYDFNNQQIEENSKVITSIDNILSIAGRQITHIRPIVLYFNLYEMSEINGWDGNKMEMGDNYLLARKGSFGIKHEDNTFTGVVVGIKHVTDGPDKSDNRKGMFGFNHNKQTFSLDAENGAAIFGKAGTGQIIIDPTQSNSMLYSSNYWIDYNNITGLPSNYNANNHETADHPGVGMLINLKDSVIHLGSATTGKIYSGSHSTLGSSADGFYLSRNGLSIGNGFIIASDGVATATQNGGNLGGWRIKTDVNGEGGFVSKDGTGILLDSKSSTIVLGSSTGKIYSGAHTTLGDTSNEGFYLSNQGLSIIGKDAEGNKNKFYISTSSDPVIYTGKHTSLTDKDPGYYIGADGLSIGSAIRMNATDGGSVLVGNLKSGNKYWTINGDTSKASITYGTRGNANSVSLRTDEFTIGSKFYVSASDGSMRLGNGAVADTGKYWSISTNEEESYIAYNTTSFDGNNGVYIGTDGIRLKSKFSVDKNGAILSKSGFIGGWAISSDSISSDNIELKAKGSIKHTGGKWEINQDGSTTFKNLSATSKDGESSSWSINRNGSASFSNVTITGGSLTIGKDEDGKNYAHISNNGDAKFRNVTVYGNIYASGGHIGSSNNSISSTGLTFKAGELDFGGTNITSTGTQLTANKTKVGSKALGTYVGDIVADTVTADFIDTLSIHADNIKFKDDTVAWTDRKFMTDFTGSVSWYTNVNEVVTDVRVVETLGVVTDVACTRVTGVEKLLCGLTLKFKKTKVKILGTATVDAQYTNVTLSTD